jgi:S-adenosylmethionine:tRNA ribosyltransferase-isomerase
MLTPGDLLVFNNSKVVPASLYLDAERFILFTEPQEATFETSRVICPFKPRVGDEFDVAGAHITLIAHEPGWDVYHARTRLEEKYDSIYSFLLENGRLPVPIYLKRIPTQQDEAALQNVYAKNEGSIATPVAGMHFSSESIIDIRNKGIEIAEVTLHVGYGTFRSFKTEYIDQHVMDGEVYSVTADSMESIIRAKARGSKLFRLAPRRQEYLSQYLIVLSSVTLLQNREAQIYLYILRMTSR